MDNQIEIERGLLDILLAHPEKTFDVLSHIDTDVFMYLEHQEIFEAILTGIEEGTPRDYKTILPFVECKNTVVDLMGFGLVKDQAVPYAKTLSELYSKRRIKEVMSSLKSEEDKAREMVEILGERDKKKSKGRVVSLSSAMEETIQQIQAVHKNGGYIGLDTGINHLDKMVCGLENGNLYVIAARPAMGKTALAITIAMNVARQNKAVQFFSLEMSEHELCKRVFARYTNNSMYSQKTGQGVDFIGLTKTRDMLSGNNFQIDATSGPTADWICESARRMAATKRPNIIFIDHLGIIAERKTGARRDLEVGYMTMRLRNLGKELDCPVVLLHQLNRGVESRDNKKPTLSDLRDSGSVEQDADVVMMIYREEYYLQKEEKEPVDHDEWVKSQQYLDEIKGRADIIVAKNRQGETGVVKCTFDGVKQEFRD